MRREKLILKTGLPTHWLYVFFTTQRKNAIYLTFFREGFSANHGGAFKMFKFSGGRHL